MGEHAQHDVAREIEEPGDYLDSRDFAAWGRVDSLRNRAMGAAAVVKAAGCVDLQPHAALGDEGGPPSERQQKGSPWLPVGFGDGD